MDSDGVNEGHQLTQLSTEVSEIKVVLNKVVEAISRLALFEERQDNVAKTTNKILERVERIEERQHRSDIESATNANQGERLKVLENVVKEMHIENERNKAQFQTVVWMVRGFWALVGSGGLLWLFNALTHTTITK
jgi:Asp-tRNA(Asn)/Glu-tRNA(Gln) amidotransferase C subunit